MSQLRRRLIIAQAGRLSSLLFLIALGLMALGVMAFGTAAGAELFKGLNAPLEIPPGAAIAELPAPREVPTDIAAELKRLQKQIDELQAARDAALGGEKAPPKAADKEKAGGKTGEEAEKASEKSEKPVADRLSTVEKSLGKLVDASDKKKKEDAKKPSFVFSG